MLLGTILGSEHPWHDEAPTLGTVALEGDVSSLAGAARAPLDALLLDASVLEPADLDAIRAYRIARPTTRIVVALPDGAEPGSPVLAGLVALGVYDLVQGLSLADALGRTHTYADAVRWSATDIDSATGQVRPKVEIRERIVERAVPLTQRPVLIGILGSAPGVGTTTVAVAIAAYLARLAPTALAEYGEPSCILFTNSPDREWNRITVYPQTPQPYVAEEGARPVPKIRDLVRGRRHAYIVADLGACGLADARAIDPDLVIVALPGDRHRALRWLSLAQSPEAQYLPAAVVGGGSAEARETAWLWRDGTGGDAHVLPPPDRGTWPPQSPALDETLGQLLAPILPEVPHRRRGFGPHLPAFRRQPRRFPAATQVAEQTTPTAAQPTPEPLRSTPAPVGAAVAARRTTVWDAVRALFGAVGGIVGLVGVVLEAAITLALVPAIGYVAILAWHTAQPHDATAASLLAGFYHWLHHPYL